MFRFYVSNITNGLALLDENESRHCSKVLRKSIGDVINLVDGKGGLHEARIESVSKKNVNVKIIISEKIDPIPFKVHIVVAPTKNMNRLEWLYEKLTEIGVESITPIICQRSERKKLRIDRLDKVVLSAMKQSLKAYLPQVNDVISFKDFIKKDNNIKHKYIAHCLEKDKQSILKDYIPQSDCVILIGPEGDFSEEEINLALENGYKPLDLGRSRLRTETAALMACHSINFVNNW